MSKLNKIFLHILLFLPIFFASATETISPVAAPPNDWLSYAKFIYPFMISVGAVLAVIMLIIAGLQMMTGSESMHSAAKERIQNALIGLFLLLGVYLILNTINPALLNLKIDTSGLQTSGSPSSSGLDTNGDGVPDGDPSSHEPAP